MPYWLTEILRRTRRHRRSPTGENEEKPRLCTPDERAREQEIWEQARQRVQRRHVKRDKTRRGETPNE
jgi:hypothetical protein